MQPRLAAIYYLSLLAQYTDRQADWLFHSEIKTRSNKMGRKKRGEEILLSPLSTDLDTVKKKPVKQARERAKLAENRDRQHGDKFPKRIAWRVIYLTLLKI